MKGFLGALVSVSASGDSTRLFEKADIARDAIGGGVTEHRFRFHKRHNLETISFIADRHGNDCSPRQFPKDAEVFTGRSHAKG